MRTNRELEMLYTKFDRDVTKYSRWFRLLLAMDQLGNVLFWNGSMDETISSHIHRKVNNGTATWFDKLVCNMLNKIESSHCYKSRGE